MFWYTHFLDKAILKSVFFNINTTTGFMSFILRICPSNIVKEHALEKHWQKSSRITSLSPFQPQKCLSHFPPCPPTPSPHEPHQPFPPGALLSAQRSQPALSKRTCPQRKKKYFHHQTLHTLLKTKRIQSQCSCVGIAEGGARTRDLEVVLITMIRATRSTD